jgi:uncharacterized protein YbjT (DUF2867 family)
MAEKSILITGVTGSQGGAVARELVGKGFKLRGLTRKPEGETAKQLSALGIELVKGDLDDEDSLNAALQDTWGVYSVQNTWEAGVEKEEAQGVRLAKLAQAAGVEHFVYTSVGSAHLNTGIPHFDNKSRVEDAVREARFTSHVIFRPVFFMENLLGGWFLQGDKLVAALKPDTSLQMICVKDIGRVEAQGFTRAKELKGQEIDLAGDSVTLAHAAKVLGDALGKPLSFVSIPVAEVAKNSGDFALMMQWFEDEGYSADIPALDEKFGKMTRFDEWAKTAKPAAG